MLPHAKTQDTIWEKPKAKMARGVTQVIEHLPSKFEALSSVRLKKKNNLRNCWVGAVGQFV
jgi:hypothetical protein